MVKVTILLLFAYASFGRHVSGRIYFEGQNMSHFMMQNVNKETKNMTIPEKIELLPVRIHQDVKNLTEVTENKTEVKTDKEKTEVKKEVVKKDSNNEIREYKIISQGVTNLALKIQKILGNGEDNLIFAPVSIASSLALVLLGAKGNTADEIARLLGVFTGVDLTNRKEIVHQQLGKFFNSLESGIDQFLGEQLTFASGVFIQDGFSINPDYDSIAQKTYRSEVISVDFKNKAEDSLNTINNWVENRTQGHIKSLLNNPPSPATTAVIANALFFNGEWEYPFFKHTTMRTFYITPENPVQTLMMVNAAKVPYLFDRERHFKMVGLPYKGGDLLMYVVVPESPLETFLNTLTAQDIENMINRATNNQTVIFLLPKLELDSKIELRPALQKMGIQDMFDPTKSDLSGLAKGIYASDVVHKVHIEITETGTTAAAATAVTMERISVPYVAANKPFLFFIYHKPTQSIIFWGSVHKPINPSTKE